MLFHDITNLPFSLNPRTTALQIRKGVLAFLNLSLRVSQKVTKS